MNIRISPTARRKMAGVPQRNPGTTMDQKNGMGVTVLAIEAPSSPGGTRRRWNSEEDALFALGSGPGLQSFAKSEN
ncbi:MAG: hypothetical protein LAO21_06960 [Acidobacteriia bacterium]|nr:hypothetical protein [Terriglobia bacterium]